MYGDKIHHTQNQRSHFKQEESRPESYQQMVTAIKKQEREICTQVTPRPARKILLFDQNKHRHFFPLLRDRDAGIETKYQRIVIQSHNDDDKQTSSTQLQRGIIQTLEDLYQVIQHPYSQ